MNIKGLAAKRVSSGHNSLRNGAFTISHSTSNSVLALGVTELAKGLKNGAISPVEALGASIARAEAAEPHVNALVGLRFDAAREEARAAETALVARRHGKGKAQGELPPFLGVPCTIKEAICLQGMPNTIGSHYYRDRVAARDAPSVARLKQAGFIPIGATNVPECCFWTETTNVVFGRTKNPHALGHSAGGSSGGEGAAVAAGYTPLGLGSDIGGSIRIPAFFNGIFGLKPTPGLVPLTDHWPYYRGSGPAKERLYSNFNAIGPMTRRAEDLLPVLQVIMGPDGFDQSVKKFTLQAPQPENWRGCRVLVLPSPKMSRVPRASQEMVQAAQRAAAHFAAQGAIVEELPEALFLHSFNIWALSLMEQEKTQLDVEMGGGKRPNLWLEIPRFFVGGRRHTAAAIVYACGQRLMPIQPRKAFFPAEGRRLREELIAKLGGDGILLMPPHPRPAPKHVIPLFRPFDHAYTAIFNILQFPAVTIPLGVNAEGLPLGVQAAAAPFRDHIAVAAAMSLQSEFGAAPVPRDLTRVLGS